MNLTGPREFWVSKQRVIGALRLLALRRNARRLIGWSRANRPGAGHPWLRHKAEPCPIPPNNPGLVWDCETLLGLKGYPSEAQLR